jgi:hypothetical protein
VATLLPQCKKNETDKNEKIKTAHTHTKHFRVSLPSLQSHLLICFFGRTTQHKRPMGAWIPSWLRSLKKNKPLPHTLDDIRVKGKTVGIDLSIYLHKALSTSEGSRQATSVPSIPVLAIESELSKLIKILGVHDMNAVWVLDGLQNPAKSGEDEKRAK